MSVLNIGIIENTKHKFNRHVNPALKDRVCTCPIDQYDFDKLSKTEGSARERIRYLAFAHIREGKSFTQAAKATRIELRSLRKWVALFREHGIEGLQEKPGRRAKSFLPPEHEAVLELQENRSGGRVRGSDVLDLMQKTMKPYIYSQSIGKINTHTYNALGVSTI